MSPNSKSPACSPDSARSSKKAWSIARAGIIRRRRAVGSNAVLGSSAASIGILIVLLALLRAGALATVLGREEQALARMFVGDRSQHRTQSAMELDPILTAVARARAEDMARRRYFSHVNPEGLGPNSLLRSAGYPLPAFWSGSRSSNFVESIGAGYATAGEAWQAWMNSRSHRTHLLALNSFYRDQTSFGIGSYSDPSSPYGRYWVIITAPPASRSSEIFSSHRPAKTARVGVAVPVWSGTDAEDSRAYPPESAPRPSATHMRVREKLWDWKEPVSALPPVAQQPDAAF